jgi:inosine/xanthosine triphosphatase
MKVIIASKNPVKLASVQRAFSTYFSDQTLEYAALEVDSQVRDQPLTIQETITGAVNRARNASSKDADYAVGIEGGISFQDIHDHEYGVEISWVCVRDCRTGKSEIASSAGFAVFPKVLKHIHAGKNLSQAMETEYGLTNLGQKNGYIGWLSNDIVTRESSNFEAVLLALSSLHKESQS